MNSKRDPAKPRRKPVKTGNDPAKGSASKPSSTLAPDSLTVTETAIETADAIAGGPVSAAPLGKDEMNFAEFPITLLTDRVPEGQTLLKFEDQIYDVKRKRMITRKRLIEGSKEFGLPTATDDTVILALIQLTKLASDFKERAVEFSRLELIKMLGWRNEGANYARIKLSLQRIAHVTYNYDNAWWDARSRSWTTKIFHIIDTVEINDSRGESDRTRIVWNEVVFESFQSGFLRNIDFQLCMKLEHPTALRMYRFLGKRFYVSRDLTFDLREFAFEHIGINGNYEGGAQIARKLQPAIDELESVGFLEALTPDERFLKNGRNWQIRLVRKQGTPLPSSTAVAGSTAIDPFETLDESATIAADPFAGAEGAAERADLAARLAERGVSKKQAERIAVDFSATVVRSKLEIFDWLIETKDKRVSKNASGWLVQSIQEGYAEPKGFIPQAERQRLAGEPSRAVLDDAADRTEKRQAAARERSELKAIDAYWRSLSKTEQDELDAMLTAGADPEELAKQTGPFRKLGQAIRRREHIRQIIRARQPTLFDV